jgi:hypothetical protein
VQHPCRFDIGRLIKTLGRAITALVVQADAAKAARTLLLPSTTVLQYFRHGLSVYRNQRRVKGDGTGHHQSDPSPICAVSQQMTFTAISRHRAHITCRGRRREVLSESRMRVICMSGSICVFDLRRSWRLPRPSVSLLQRHAPSSTASDRNADTAQPIERSSVRVSS